MSTRETHAWTCEEGETPTFSSEATKLQEEPFWTEKGTEKPPGFRKDPFTQTEAVLGV